ncbi:hypothetical protein BTR23_21545 [Alkalihalophilus pseudofirmus]|uniref:DUF1002 domain-containing protein n=1 Tax=Alkalihalobacterium alkalinitrilicum TaxID=427920 RepID=UPI00094D7AA8|nr:DUF1002 domain-containing protein [Alkalihalobacterium alkalinitrilicum]OLO26954.1 hypothetical protein BTR23_21545 [Alkalihalophilus pseudofirmus]
MKLMKQKFLPLLLILSLLLPSIVVADAAPGDMIVTLGEDLTAEQRQSLLNEMGAPADVEIIYVTNEEEHQYLGNYVNARQIGTRAISSSMITLTESGSGLNIETNNISWVSEGMYANALVTAGVKDADIYVTAPFEVSGTAGLTGIIKAYEITAEIDIPEEQKQIANEEMVRTGKLAESIGMEEATELMNRIKEEIAKNPVETEDDLRALIQRVAQELGVTLTDEELNGLVSLFMRIKDLNIDWNQVQNQIGKIRDNLGDFLNREDTQSFIASMLDVLNRFIDAIKGLFR